MNAHDELLKVGNFDEKFKNPLRNYYNYGFKGLDEYIENKKRREPPQDWVRLNNILGDYVKWSDKKSKNRILYATQDSQSMSINPFHRIYRFCKYLENHPAYFFHTMAALHDKITLREGIESLSSDPREQNRLHRVIDARSYHLSNELRHLHLKPKERDKLCSLYDEDTYFLEELDKLISGKRLQDDQIQACNRIRQILMDHEIKLKVSDLIWFFSDAMIDLNIIDRRRTPNYRLKDFEHLGLIRRTTRKNESNRQTDAANKDKNPLRQSSGQTLKLSPLTIGKIITAGTKVNDDFERHFHSFLDFFSKYYLMGEVGTFLLDRLDVEESSPFRMKHEYFMQSMNDYNMIDLIYAMEHEKWCRIRYHHGMSEFQTELLCFPLEIRVSSTSGREYLMYYEPLKRSYTGLRIEFIDEIFYYSKGQVQKALEKNISPTDMGRDIQNARWALQHTWGTSAPNSQDGNAKEKPTLHTVKLRIQYDKKKEYYIRNRLFRERRHGRVLPSEEDGYLEYYVTVTDPMEMKPWIRSFYSRIDGCEGMKDSEFSMETDLETTLNNIQWGLSLPEYIEMSDKDQNHWNIPEPVKVKLGSGEAAREHEKLFHEIFSVYYHVMAYVFERFCLDENGLCTDQILEDEIANSFEILSEKLGMKTEKHLPQELRTLFLEKGFVYDGSFKYYANEEIQFYRDVVPLTELELRWLKTTIMDVHAQYFLNQSERNEIGRILDELAPDIHPLPMRRIIYYDRYWFPKANILKEAIIMEQLLNSIDKEKMIHLSYRTNHGDVISDIFEPVTLEFSKRNNCFQVWCVSSKNNWVYAINLSTILKAEMTEQAYHYKKAKDALNQYRERNYRHVTLEFYDRNRENRNIADRILTELSPWKKECQYDKNSGHYKLTVYYQKMDELDLVIRLLGYGSRIRMLDYSHSIGLEMKNRVEMQRERLERESSRIPNEREER